MSRPPVVLLTVCLVALSGALPALGASLYDGRLHDPPLVVRGVRAHILTGGLPNLHGGVFSCVWAMVCKDDWSCWAQAGYRREAGETTLERWAQWTDVDGVWREAEGAAPAGAPTYECLQDGIPPRSTTPRRLS